MSKKRIFLWRCFLFLVTGCLAFSAPVKSQDCGCDHVLALSDTYVDANKLNINPGDVICIQGGKRSHLGLLNFQGTAENPLIFKNCNGQAVVENYTLGYGIKFMNSKYIKLTGTGDLNHTYGIKVAGTKDGANGIQVGDLSSDFEIEFVEVTNTGFAGIMAKTDPNCEGTANRGNFIMRNMHLHNNYIHDIGGEGMYIGNSFYSGKSQSCGGSQVTLYPHDIIGLKVHDNLLYNTGWEAIQVGCASQDAEIYNNHITRYGQTGGGVQNNGIQVGEGTTGKVYHNLVKEGPGNGIIVLGMGNNLVYNNIIIRPGEYGIFCDNRVTQSGSQMSLINNSIIEPALGGILNYSEVTVNKCYNNIITGANSSIRFGSGATGDLKNNILGIMVFDPQGQPTHLASTYFVDAANDNYHLADESPAIDAGLDVSALNIVCDYEGNARPVFDAYDVGAYECGAQVLPPVITDTVLTDTIVVIDTISVDVSPGDEGILITTSSYQDPNIPENTLDGDLTTRWSAEGIGAWIQYDLRGVTTISAIEIAFLSGDQRISYFDVDLSLDGVNWNTAFSGESSGAVNGLERFDLEDQQMQYLRITGHGNTQNTWNSIQEVVFDTTMEISEVQEEVVWYRINAGGPALADPVMDWAADRQNAPSGYLALSSSNNTTGSDQWTGANTTDAPNSLFGPNRYDGPWGGTMLWQFPVSEGNYRVNLYFAEKPNQVNSAGQRIFDVAMENTVVLQNLDIYGEVGLGALQKTAEVTVEDGVLDIVFIRKTGDPQINGIEVVLVGKIAQDDGGTVTGEAPVLVQARGITVYPNPFADHLNVAIANAVAGHIQASVYNYTGKLVYQSSYRTAGEDVQMVMNLSHLANGLYVVHIADGNHTRTYKLLKQ